MNRFSVRHYIPIFLTICLASLTVAACRQEAERGRVPSEVNEVVASVGENIAQERYEQIYYESSDLWKRDATLEQSNQVFKTLRIKLGKVETRTLHSATEQQNSGGALKGHIYILTYQTRFERGDGMETFTLIEENGRWLLARYFVNSTALT
jgi:basic membrane lipoprotein Med (substrate-binding protein (PBP1-ABC) superfamily)